MCLSPQLLRQAPSGAGCFFGAILFLMPGFNHLAEYVSPTSVLLAGLPVRAVVSTPRERPPLDP